MGTPKNGPMPFTAKAHAVTTAPHLRKPRGFNGCHIIEGELAHSLDSKAGGSPSMLHVACALFTRGLKYFTFAATCLNSSGSRRVRRR